MTDDAATERRRRDRARQLERDGSPLSLLASFFADNAWMGDAACRGKDPELFFETEAGATYHEARAICAECPASDACLDFGLDLDFGMWGGTSPKERRQLRRERRAS